MIFSLDPLTATLLFWFLLVFGILHIASGLKVNATGGWLAFAIFKLIPVFGGLGSLFFAAAIYLNKA